MDKEQVVEEVKKEYDDIHQKFKALSDYVNKDLFDNTDENGNEIEPIEYDMEMATEEDKASELKKSLNEQYKLSDKDATSVISVIERLDSGETFNVLEALPMQLGNIVRKLCAANGISSKKLMNEFARDLVNNIRNDANISAEINNFHEVLNKELQTTEKIDSMSSLYSSHMRDYMENKLLENAEQYKESKPETYEKLNKLSAIYSESYTFDRIIDTYKKNRKCRVKELDWKIDYNKYCLNFDRALYQHTPLNASPISEIIDLGIPGSDFTDEDIKKIIVAISKHLEQCINIKDIYDQAFIYYTANNIHNICLVSSADELSDFDKEIIANMHKLLDVINNK
jgi:hypothetical protein